ISLQISGNGGTANALSLGTSTLTNQDSASPIAWVEDAASDPTGESVATSLVAYDSLGNAVNVNVTAVLESKADTGNTWRFFVQSPDDTVGGNVVSTGMRTLDNFGRRSASRHPNRQTDRH